MPRISDCSIRRGRWLLPVAALVVFGGGHRSRWAHWPSAWRPQVRRRSGCRAAAQVAVLGCCLRHADHCARAPASVSAPALAFPYRRPGSRPPAAAPAESLPLPAREGCRGVPEPMAADGGGGDDECNCAVTTATTIRPASGSARSGKRRKTRSDEPLAVSSQRPYKDARSRPAGHAVAAFIALTASIGGSSRKGRFRSAMRRT